MFSTRLIILAIFCISSATCKLCDLTDEKCVTSSAQRIFPKWVAGIPGVEPSDPLHADRIEANLPKLKYIITDGTLTGMKDCKVDSVKIDAKNPKYDLYFTCPLIKIESSFEIKGEIGPHFAEGSGKCKVDHYGYSVHFFGDYETKTKDGKLYLSFKNFDLDLDAKEKVVYDFKDVLKGDKKKSDEIHQFLEGNWKAVDKQTGGPAMHGFMTKFMKNVNQFLDIVPAEDIFSQE